MVIQISASDHIILQASLLLVHNVFHEFEAPHYSSEGIEEFERYITLHSVQEKLRNNELLMWGYVKNSKPAGVIATRFPCHISLFFVDKNCHNQGIGRVLLKTAFCHNQQFHKATEATVHSSLYAADIYRHFGFQNTDVEKTVNGMRFIPMKRQLCKTF